ncbi:MFS transporter (plasmid) [Polaromonas hydrogenivorans]|uniref:Putative tartrate transporter n=2 Tax=Polaromonas hydrogenivorans TaxID=335476 RepID=A0AAU7LZT5_9BURK
MGTERLVVDKVTRHLMWFLFLLFVVSFLDRINIGFAGLTMMKDLGLTSTQFGLATTLFYIAYISCGIPSNLVLARIGARKWIGSIMIAWGLASTATMFATSPQSLYFFRILVGITEAGFLPGMLLYLTYWFPSAYRARANALFMIAMPVTAAVGSAISGAILGMDGILGLKGWQWLFLLEGLPAAILGVVVYFYLNDSPQQARWLTNLEKTTLARMLAAEHQADPVAKPTGPRASLLSELTSATVLKFSVAYFCLVNSLAMVAVWTPLIVKSFSGGASNTTIGLLAAIPSICTVIGMIWWGRRSDRAQERRWHTVLPMLLAASGWLITAYSPQPALQLLGICLASTGAYTAMSIFWTTPDHALSFTARALGIAVINAVGNIGSALNPLVVGWLKDATQSFATGLIYASVLLVVGCAVMLIVPIPRTPKLAAST